MRFTGLHMRDTWEQLDPNIRSVAEEFDAWCQASGLGEAIITSTLRSPDFYKKNGLKQPKFSWHYVGCAIDWRIRHWNPDEQLKAKNWLTNRLRDSWYEMVLESHGTGQHFHTGYRNFQKRRQWEAQEKKT